jgi:hypothetical protein
MPIFGTAAGTKMHKNVEYIVAKSHSRIFIFIQAAALHSSGGQGYCAGHGLGDHHDI